jgi:hypothetical protein
MNGASQRVLNVKLYPFAGAQDPAVVGHLKKIATAFSELYEQRQTADYDLVRQWSRTEVLALIESVAEAFSSIKMTRDEPVMNDYLLSVFLKERK